MRWIVSSCRALVATAVFSVLAAGLPSGYVAAAKMRFSRPGASLPPSAIRLTRIG